MRHLAGIQRRLLEFPHTLGALGSTKQFRAHIVQVELNKFDVGVDTFYAGLACVRSWESPNWEMRAFNCVVRRADAAPCETGRDVFGTRESAPSVTG